MSAVDIEIRSDPTDLAAEWRALTRRATPNVFMDPAMLVAAREAGLARPITLLAWDRSGPEKILVGLWALAERQIGPLGPAYLSAPLHRQAMLSSPAIDPRHTDAVVAAFLGAIATHPDLPKVVRIKYLDGDFPSAAALMRATRSRRSLVLSERMRAFVDRATGPKRSGSTRKKLRQEWNRLSAEGVVDMTNERDPTAVKDAFETFLAMEQKSWKGVNGTALLSNAREARFARTMIASLAAEGNASVALLRLDGRPIAAQVVLYCGTMAYTWKTAYDARYERHSPGTLLVDKVTDQLLETGGVDAIESCSPEGGYLTALWPGRRRTIDLLVDLGGRRSLTFALIALGVRGYAEAKAWRGWLRAWLAAQKSRKPAPAP